MAIPSKKRSSLLEFGLSEDFLARIEGANKADADEATDAGVDSKEITPDTKADADEVVAEEKELKEDDEVADGADAGEAGEEEAKSEADEEKESGSELKEIQGVLAKVINVANKMLERMDAIEESVGNLRVSEDERVAEKARATPVASLTSLADSLEATVIGSKETKVDGRTKLNSAGPEEADVASESKTAFPWINDMIAGVK